MNGYELRERVRAEMKAKGWSARRVSEEAKKKDPAAISNSAISDWLRGDAEVSDGVRYAIHLAFGWPMDWPENPPPAPLPDVVVSPLDVMNAKLDEILALIRALALRLGGPPPAGRRRR